MPQDSGRVSLLSTREVMPRGKIFQHFQVLKFFSVLTVIIPVFFMGCQHRNGSHFDEIAWNGEALSPQREFPNPSAIQLHEEGFSVSFSPAPTRLLSFHPADLKGDLKLLEFPGENEAYGAFQRISNSSELSQGYLSRDDHVFFRKGRWLGMFTGDSGTGEEWLKNKLQLPGDEDWGALPQAFSSLLHQDRIPESERILFDHFIGVPLSHAVFAARFDCRGDSAWVYFSPGMSDLSIQPEPKKPLKLDFSEAGMVGVEGCFDDSLTNYWIQTQKKVLKSLKLGGIH